MIKDTDIRKFFISFRIRSHTCKLEIERGRYKNFPVKDRLCKLCNSEAVEDGKHFICKLYTSLRQIFFADVNHVKTVQVYRRVTSSFDL